MKDVEFVDLKRLHLPMKEKLHELLDTVIDSSEFSGGSFVTKFENEFADYIKIRHAIGVNSGTSALTLAMKSLGIRQGDEVLIPGLTFIATAWAVRYLGATPVFVDCAKNSVNISWQDAERKVTEKTKAVIAVHMYGIPFAVEEAIEFADKHHIYLVEDCAQAFGSKYRGQSVGTFGDIGCFSFYPTKNLGGLGENGAVVTNNSEIEKRIRILCNQGRTTPYTFDDIGFNMRMDGIQAAWLSAKLECFGLSVNKKRRIAKYYTDNIHNKSVLLPNPANGVVFHLYVILVEDRIDFINYLNTQGIGYGLHYPVCCHLQRAFADLEYKVGDLPNAEYTSEHCVSLPFYSELEESEMKRVVTVVNQYNPKRGMK